MWVCTVRAVQACIIVRCCVQAVRCRLFTIFTPFPDLVISLHRRV